MSDPSLPPLFPSDADGTDAADALELDLGVPAEPVVVPAEPADPAPTEVDVPVAEVSVDAAPIVDDVLVDDASDDDTPVAEVSADAATIVDDALVADEEREASVDEVEVVAAIDEQRLTHPSGIDLYTEPDPDDVKGRTRLAIARAEVVADAKEAGLPIPTFEAPEVPPTQLMADAKPSKAMRDEGRDLFDRTVNRESDGPSSDEISERTREAIARAAAADEARKAEKAADAEAKVKKQEARAERAASGGGDQVDFASLGLHAKLLDELDSLGYEEPTPIQAEAIPPLLESRDLLGQAATGTGKTAAFALPVLHRLANEVKGARGKAPLALVLTPTRELAMQVSEAIHRYGRGMNAQVTPVYGGQPIWRQLKALERGVDVVVGTPGRVIDHLRRGSLDLSMLQVVVLDEADEMLDMGFQEDIEEILGSGPEYRQTMLFSATMPNRIAQLARKHLHEPVRITIERDTPEAGESPLIEQRAYVVARQNKAAALGRILDVENPHSTIVFCGTRNEVDELTRVMNGRGYRAEALHGGMTQDQRDKVMDRLRKETAELLVATDVAARGLDIDHLTHVVNYDVPNAPESYVHRIGRVGRAGREGTAISLVEPRQHRLLQAIERHTGTKLHVAQVPSIEDLRQRRDDQVRLEIEDRLEDAEPGDLDRYRKVLERLAEDHDLVDVALAAIAIAKDAIGADADEEEGDLPEVRLHTDGPGNKGGKYGNKGGSGKSGGPSKFGGTGPRGKTAPSGPPAHGTARLWIGVGFQGKVRPKDIVGAIANETSVRGADIGNIDIAPKFTLVDVPESKAQEVIDALENTTLQGRRPKVRRDRS